MDVTSSTNFVLGYPGEYYGPLPATLDVTLSSYSGFGPAGGTTVSCSPLSQAANAATYRSACFANSVPGFGTHADITVTFRRRGCQVNLPDGTLDTCTFSRHNSADCSGIGNNLVMTPTGGTRANPVAFTVSGGAGAYSATISEP